MPNKYHYDGDIEELIENHSTFIFAKEKSSNGIDENGEEFDHSFVTQNGRVYYEQKENESYLVTLKNDEVAENRILTFSQLEKWFYEPTEKYFQENILEIPVV